MQELSYTSTAIMKLVSEVHSFWATTSAPNFGPMYYEYLPLTKTLTYSYSLPTSQLCSLFHYMLLEKLMINCDQPALTRSVEYYSKRQDSPDNSVN